MINTDSLFKEKSFKELISFWNAFSQPPSKHKMVGDNEKKGMRESGERGRGDDHNGVIVTDAHLLLNPGQIQKECNASKMKEEKDCLKINEAEDSPKNEDKKKKKLTKKEKKENLKARREKRLEKKKEKKEKKDSVKRKVKQKEKVKKKDKKKDGVLGVRKRTWIKISL